MEQKVCIGNRLIGHGCPCFVIAEAGVNHNGDVRLAHRLIDGAVEAGVEAVKFQSYVTEELVIQQAPKAAYQIETTGEDGDQYEMLKTLELTAEQQAELKAHCEQAGILYLCTPYDHASVDMLDHMGVEAFKIASSDITNIPLLLHMATKKRPVILSTGMSTLGEVEQAVNTLRGGGLEEIILLHCTSQYPAPVEEANLLAMATMRQAFGCPVGFSDHTYGIEVSTWAVAAGACLVEKHFTIDRSLKGPDHRASIEPQELKDLVDKIRNVEAALGDGIKRITPTEMENKVIMQKSLVSNRRISAGERIRAQDLTCKRPGTGLKPDLLDRVVGKVAAGDIEQNEIITLSSIEWD